MCETSKEAAPAEAEGAGVDQSRTAFSLIIGKHNVNLFLTFVGRRLDSGGGWTQVGIFGGGSRTQVVIHSQHFRAFVWHDCPSAQIFSQGYRVWSDCF